MPQETPAAWDPAAYESFAPQRGRALEDLLARVPALPAGSVVDAGCGTGRTTAQIAARWPDRDVLGIDASGAMLERARAAARTRFAQADLRTWVPGEAAALVVANAVLHWLPDAEGTLRHVASWVCAGGVLAIQVPANHEAPSHRAVQEAAGGNPRVAALSPADHVLPLHDYARLLRAQGWEVTAWETTYLHVLTGADPVLRWLQGTTLRPHLSRLGQEAAPFLEDLGGRLRALYPPEPDGATLFPFTRRFVVATAPG